MYDTPCGRLDAAMMNGFDPRSVIADKAEPPPLSPEWHAALDAAIADTRAERTATRRERVGARLYRISTHRRERKADAAHAAQIERELQHELAERDREWWGE